MAPSDTDSDETTDDVQIEIYMTAGHTRGDDVDTSSERFRVGRDLRGFGSDAFEEFGHEPAAAFETALDPVFEFTVAEIEDTDAFLEDIYSRMQGPRQDDEIGYDGGETRSLTVGDVIVVDGTPHMVDLFGFETYDLTLGDDGESWDPDPASLRDAESEDLSGHARANIEQLRAFEEDDQADEDAEGDV